MQCTLLLLKQIICKLHSRAMVRTDPGKVWKVLEFNVEILEALKGLENYHR